eukprot:TRINITY_DN994_c1_g3_i2.p1 TRINITY_DN994_c1_g3~~TRINITY_DN994_c1_g3_i2.p1  ORF type:complete len:213 (+),score=25.29 TRINITY_DN994_c1_g3_i2:89-727(+)
MQRVVTEGALQFLSMLGHYIRNTLPAGDLMSVMVTLTPEELNSITCEFKDPLGQKWIACRQDFEEIASSFSTWQSKQEIIEIASRLSRDPGQLAQPIRPLVGFGGKPKMVSGEYESPIKCAERWLTTSDRNKKLNLCVSKATDNTYWRGNVPNIGHPFNATLHVFFETVTKGNFNLLQPPPSWELQRMEIKEALARFDLNEGVRRALQEKKG